jgi:c-di-GMP phosphodiesterase
VTFVALAYVQAMESARASLDRTAAVAVHRADELIEDAQRILTRLATDSDLTPSRETIKLLARAEYIDPRFREIGLVDDSGFLVATNFGSVDPPVKIPPGQRADPLVRQLQVIGNFETALMREYSVVLALPTRGQGEFELLVDPVILVDFLAEIDRDPDGFIAFTRQDGAVLAKIGAAPVRNDVLVLDNDVADLRVVQSSNQGHIIVVVDATMDWVLRKWREELLLVAPVAVVCNAFLVFLVLRRSRRHAGLDHDLRLGLKRGEFAVHYQPIVELGTGQCIGVEALSRWRHPEHDMVAPDVFIPLAEKTGALPALTDWLLERVAAETQGFLTFAHDFLLAINIAPSQLASGSASRLIRSITNCSIERNRLILEVTETSLLESHGSGYRSAMSELRCQGVAFALDDFGTGSSSFENIVEAEIKYLKIDKSFVRSIGRDPRRVLILDGLIELAHKLDLNVIAEGVEKQEQRSYLLDRGVRYGQGWLFSPAMSAAELATFLSAGAIALNAASPRGRFGVLPSSA